MKNGCISAKKELKKLTTEEKNEMCNILSRQKSNFSTLGKQLDFFP